MDSKTTTKQDSITINTQQLIDHDLIIKIATTQDSFISEYRQDKIDSNFRIAKIELWKEGIDVYHAGIPLAKYQEMYEWVMKLRNNLALIGILGTALLAIVVFIIDGYLRKLLNL